MRSHSWFCRSGRRRGRRWGKMVCCERSESFTVAPCTQPTHFPQGWPEVGLETALLSCRGCLWPPGSRTSQLPLVMSDISSRQQRVPSHLLPTHEFVICPSLPTSIPLSVPLNFPVWAASSPAWPVQQCRRWLWTAVNPWLLQCWCLFVTLLC